MKKKTIILILLSIPLIIFLIVAYTAEWRYSDKILSTEPLILSGNQKLEITDNTKFTQEGNIVLSDNAQLIVRDSYFIQQGEGAQAFSLRANDNSKVIFENSILKTSSWVDWSFGDNSELIYYKTDIKLA